jgi:WhiB family transcriptional regulator, redox-sensing transcriptional regulator
MMNQPCSADPDLWFGYSDDDHGDGAAKARTYETASIEARTLCLRRCPLAQQRRCAQHAVQHGVEFGVWAGVKLPGGQYRKRGELARAHQVLRQIADGELTPRQLPESAALLERRQADVLPVVATVFHLSSSVGRASAA